MNQREKLHNDFVISISAPTIDITNINIEEMQHYCKLRNRMASVVTEKKSYGELDKMNYQLVFNYTKPKVTSITSKNKPYLTVFEYLLSKYKSGLLIVETDTYSEAISELLCNSENIAKNDIDIMVCKNSLNAVTLEEIKKANLLRLSADLNLEESSFRKFQGLYQEKVITLMICQLFVNDQYDSFKKYIEEKSQKYSHDGKTDYVDYYELNKQLAYFIYLDVAHNKILNVSRKVIKDFVVKIQKQGILPLPDNIMNEFINATTFE